MVGGIAVVLLGTPMAEAVAGYVMYSLGSGVTLSLSIVAMVIGILAASLIVLGIVSVLGGVYAVKRSLWGLALTGAVFTFFYLLPLGIPAMIFTSLAKKEFV